MNDIRENIKEILKSKTYNISGVMRHTEVSRHWIKKIINDEPVPSYIIMALDNFFNKGNK